MISILLSRVKLWMISLKLDFPCFLQQPGIPFINYIIFKDTYG